MKILRIFATILLMGMVIVIVVFVTKDDGLDPIKLIPKFVRDKEISWPSNSLENIVSQIAENDNIPKDKRKELAKYEIEARIHLGEAEAYLWLSAPEDFEASINSVSICINKMEAILKSIEEKSKTPKI